MSSLRRAPSPPKSSLAGLNIIDDDPILRKARKAILQIFTLDYLILESYNVLNKGKEFVNPYKFIPTEEDLNKIQSICSPSATARTAHVKKKSSAGPAACATFPTDLDLCSAFMLYQTSIVLQQVFSYVFINTNRLNDLQSVDIGQLSDLLGAYGTKDNISEEDLNYIRVVRNNTVLNELENANSGTPLMGQVEEIMQEIVRCIGDLSGQDMENIIPDDFKDVNKEFERETTLIRALFEGENLSVNTVIEASGLCNLFHMFEILLPNDPREILDSPILNGVVDAWSRLFQEALPDLIDMFVSTLPTIRDRFIGSQSSTSTSQQDLFYDGLRLMIDFLDGALIPVRLDELKNLSSNPLAVDFLKVFRSLLLVSKDPNTKRGLWFVTADTKGRLKFLYVIYWLLTSKKELNVLFRFAATQSDLTRYNFGDPDRWKLVVASSMFPGDLDPSGVGLAIGTSIQLDFNNDYRRMAMKQDKVKRSGRLDVILKDDGNGWLI